MTTYTSTFKGTFFPRDVALKDPVVDTQATNSQVVKIEKYNKTVSDWLTWGAPASGNGTIISIAVKDVKLNPASRSGSTLECKNGSYTITAEFQYRVGTSETVKTDIAEFEVKIESESSIQITISDQIGIKQLSKLPGVAQTEIQPFPGQAFKPKLTIAEVNPTSDSGTARSAAISGIVINESTNVVTFPCGFVNNNDSDPKTTDLKCIDVAKTSDLKSNLECKFNILATSGDIKSISKFEISKIEFVRNSSDTTETTFTLASINITASAEGVIAGATADTSFKIDNGVFTFANTTAMTIQTVGKDVSVIPSADLELSAANTVTVSSVPFKGLQIILKENVLHTLIPLETSATTYVLDVCNLHSSIAVDSSATPNKEVVSIYYKGINFPETLHFLDKAGLSVAKINPGYTIYDTLAAPLSGSVVDFNTDAGFKVPIVENGQWGIKYVRISDLYYDLQNKSSSGGSGSDIPDLLKRLHALEVSLYDSESDLLKADSELKAIKRKYCGTTPPFSD